MDHFPMPSEIHKENYIFYSPTSADENSIRQKGGQWYLYAPRNVKKLDDWWPVLRKLCDDGTLIAIKSSTATDRVYCTIVCYTSDFENEKEVKKAADIIRKLINYKYPMYYKARKSIAGLNPDFIYLYVHTVSGEFYKKEVTFLLPSDIYWKKTITFFAKHRGIITEEDKRSSGRWTLHSFGDIHQVDQRWMVLQSLCRDDVIESTASSTGACDSRISGNWCFTPDFKNTKEVKKAADEIRKLIDYKYAMYYSTIEKGTTQPERNFEIRFDDKCMHTVNGGFYEKDKYMRWVSLMT